MEYKNHERRRKPKPVCPPTLQLFIDRKNISQDESAEKIKQDPKWQ